LQRRRSNKTLKRRWNLRKRKKLNKRKFMGINGISGASGEETDLTTNLPQSLLMRVTMGIDTENDLKCSIK
jgi:hypothetical protein